MSRIAITDYFDAPSETERALLGDLVSASPTEETEVLMVWHQTIDETYAAQFPRLRGVQRYGVGFDNLDLEYLKARDIVCANNPDYGVDEVSDSAMAFILNISRGISRYDNIARELREDWQENVLTHLRRNCETTVGVIGAGRIGSSVLLKCQAIGFRTILFDPYREAGCEKVLRAKRAMNLDELLSEADIVSLHLPLNSETEGIVNSKFLSQMKPGASLVNTARGGLLASTQDLHAALRADHLASVALDVLPTEPPESDDLIDAWRQQAQWLQGRLLVNPHTAYYSQEAQLDMRRSAAANALRMLNNDSPLNLL